MKANNTSPDSLDQLCVNTIRTLAIDAIQKANSGHPGAPMALAPAAYALWARVMHFSPGNPDWFDRDRFVLSNGHASALLYSLLYLTGFALSLNDLKQFRQLGSLTPGHPEYGHTPGVETTTGPLGQGLMNAVGMAVAEAHLAAVYNRDGHEIVNHNTYVFCGDGDFMEGASHEAASMAGNLGLGKLICLFDDNHISIEGDTSITCTDNVMQRFEAYNWHVINLGEQGENVNAIARAFEEAKAVTDKPSLIILRTHIGFGSPNKQDTAAAHGSPLGDEEIRLTKKAYGWPEDAAFLVPEDVLGKMRKAVQQGKELEANWQRRYAEYKAKFPELAVQFEQALNGEPAEGWSACLPGFSPEHGAIATRAASGQVINGFADKLPWLVGGSADLEPSTKTMIKRSHYFSKDDYTGRNIAYGIREHVMCSAASGMALHGGITPFVSTFFIFTDYARPAIRLAAMMGIPVIYVMTHDSIGVGEDGPTHQPVEQLASLRIIPNLVVMRPADANETVYAWRAALERRNGPTMLVLTRQGLPVLDRTIYAGAEGVLRGAYILSKEKGATPELIFLATGSEVQLVLAAQEELAESGVDARVVSMPSLELFQAQSQEYRDLVLPPSIRKRLAVEAGHSSGWRAWVGDEGAVVSIDSFGASAPAELVFKGKGFSVENIVAKAKALL